MIWLALAIWLGINLGFLAGALWASRDRWDDDIMWPNGGLN